MNRNELRIGNIARVANLTGKVTDLHSNPDEIYFDFSPDYEYSPSVVHPIPLTDEWLVKLGHTDENKHTFFGFFGLLKQGDLYHLCYLSDQCLTVFAKKFKYVHQVQNFYHELKGEELTLK